MHETGAGDRDARTPRDPRLDFFRGLAMFIIFIAHVPGNPWTLWIPARFGFSDAAEIFVFCSGMASAFAFGRIFETRGWLTGTGRILHRAWQVYWVHIALFIALAAALAALDASGGLGTGHVGRLNLERFYAEPKAALVGLVTLTYVPNYFDILPMYCVILLLLPLVVAARWWAGTAGAAALVALLWLGAQIGVLSLPAEPWSERQWFFNPFGWQLVFFTGFALVSGWLPAPPVRRWLVWSAIAVLVLSLPLAYYRIAGAWDLARAGRELMAPLIAKTEVGLLRYVHFLALAYLAFAAAGPRGARLAALGPAISVIHKVGQQALATFVAGSFLAQMAPALFAVAGKTALTVTLVNVTGFAALIATAYAVAWFKAGRAARPDPRARPAAARRDLTPAE